VASFVEKGSLPDRPSKSLPAIQRDRYPGNARPRVVSSDVSIIEVRRRDPGPSPLTRHVAAPQSIILEEHNLNKIQIMFLSQF